MEYLSFMPLQKLPESKKDEDWYKLCINGAISLIYSYDTNRRSTRYNKKINYDLYAGIFHKDDLTYVINPLGLEKTDVPASLKHYDVVTPIFNLLIGEESKRLSSYMVRAINSDAVSKKQEDLANSIKSMLMQKLSAGLSEEEKKDQSFLAQLQKYARYGYKDIREVMASRSLEYLNKKLDVDAIMRVGFEDALIAGEEIYRIDTCNGEPTFRRCNPLEIFYLLPHNSFYIDDADVIVEETWMSVGQIIDTWYEELTPEQIDYLERGVNRVGSMSDTLNYETPRNIYTSDIPEIDTINDLSQQYSYYDKGRDKIRVLRAVWKSRRKVGVINFTDENTGESERIVLDESYKPEPGEEINWLWINEYREGTRIGADIYVDKKRCRTQRRNMDNISICKSPYVGTVYNANNSVSVSLMDRIKPYQYLFNIIFYRTELALAKSYGKIMEFDLAGLPKGEGFDIDKWLYYVQAANISFKNSFEESEKGQRLGMMSGSTSNREYDMEQGQYIDKHIQLLEFIEGKIGELSGVTKQRQGQVHNRELVGNVERSVTQSSFITEKWFEVHTHTKRRVYEAIIEVAKDAWRGKSKKLQYVMDDMATVFADIDGNEFDNSEYGVFMSNSNKDNETIQMLKSLTSEGLRADKLALSSVVDIMMADSITETKNKLLDYEEAANQQKQKEMELQQQQLHGQQQMAKEQIESAMAMKQQEMDLKKYEIDSNNETKIQIAEINVFSRQQDLDTNQNGIPDPLEVGKLALEERKHDSEDYDKELQRRLKEREVSNKKDTEDKKISLDEKKLAIEEKKIAAQQKIEKLKADTAIRVAKENKTKAELSKSKK